MADIIRMPKLSDTMDEGVISSWLKKVGDKVKSGDVLAEVDTDKATMELESYNDGVLLYIGPKETDSVPVGEIIAIIGNAGEDYSSLLASDETKDIENKVTINSSYEKEDIKIELLSRHAELTSSSNDLMNDSSNSRLKVSPLAKKMITQKGYDISLIQGTGPNGRIVKFDVETFSLDNNIVTAAYGDDNYRETVMSPMRKTIAKRLTESKFTAPHFYLSIDINMDAVVNFKNEINSSIAPEKVSFNDFILKAVAISLQKNSIINTTLVDDKIRYHDNVHLGVAMAIDDGLVVPVVRFANKKKLIDISRDVKSFSSKALEGRLKSDDFKGATFTVSNLGMMGIDSFTAIINPPSTCILAVGAVKKKPIVNDDNIVVISNMVNLTLSSDHRVVDGSVGANFLKTLKDILQKPINILI